MAGGSTNSGLQAVTAISEKSNADELTEFERVYFLGIGGIGMSALARWFMARGTPVAGYDRQQSEIGRQLQSQGAVVTTDASVEAIPEAFRQARKTLVVRTPAVPDTHPQLRWFGLNGMTVRKRAEVLGQISMHTPTLAVAGTHGKTTTSVLLAHLLNEAGVRFTGILGGISGNFGSNYRSTGHDWLVTEADEYDRSFLHLHPHSAAITSTDADHLDVYGGHASMLEAYGQFARQVQKTLLVHTSTAELDWQHPNLIRYGDGGDVHSGTVRAEGLGMRFDYHGAQTLADLYLPMGGKHNVDNALAAITLALEAGVDPLRIAPAMACFQAVKRRFEYRYNNNNIILIDDYAHHPGEIDAFVAGVRLLHPGRSLMGIFQPHLFTRTRDFLEGFAASLSRLDECRVLPIYPAREEPIAGVDSGLLTERVRAAGGNCLPTSPEAVMAEVLRDPSAHVWLCIGAGDIELLANRLAQALGEHGAVNEMPHAAHNATTAGESAGGSRRNPQDLLDPTTSPS